MDLAYLYNVHGFVEIDKWTSLIVYMDMSKLLHGFVKAVKWICQSCSIYFSPLAKQNRAEVVGASALS